jgi:hypothetical protein
MTLRHLVLKRSLLGFMLPRAAAASAQEAAAALSGIST